MMLLVTFFAVIEIRKFSLSIYNFLGHDPLNFPLFQKKESEIGRTVFHTHKFNGRLQEDHNGSLEVPQFARSRFKLDFILKKINAVTFGV